MTMQLHLQSVPARNGRLWIRHGFKVFQRAPLALCGLFGLASILSFVFSRLPYVGIVLGLGVIPLIWLGFMLATHLVLQRKTPTIDVFIAPLKLTRERRGSQLALCAIYAVCIVLTLALINLVDGDVLQQAQELADKTPDPSAADQAFADPRLLWAFVLRLLAIFAVGLPFWHAPALVHWGGQGASQALFSSVLALWRNRSAFALNLLMWLVIAMAAGMVIDLLAMLLGASNFAVVLMAPLLLILPTVFYASLYFSFVDCFMFGAPSDLLSEP
jgi:hypothetical protein